MRKLENIKRGFTIVEILIVLAVAGVIVMIVLLAVPALQRNSRNTQRKSDVAIAIGAFSEYLSNNGGKLPATVAAGVASAKFGFFTGAADFSGSTVNAAAVATVTSGAGVVVNNYAKCPTALPAINVAAVTMDANPTARNVAAVYQTEVSGGFQAQCSDM